ncbi:shieldin complex subunit 2 isoform X2 [Brienomyrus brachyistius]|uniref:shieldin complex subunit 2 isoform X2 n=1 Tax=Brienomyrus brachyistius TaxID=42636 RepID=UPI0020B39D68|nr:shieldin complex subunit 2 isoform X2 [Brienomyrus brachyistius]
MSEGIETKLSRKRWLSWNSITRASSQRGDNMAAAPTIHVFLGAPGLSLDDVPGPNPDQGPWKTVNLRLEGGKLQPRKHESGGIPGEQGGVDPVTLTNEGLEQLNIYPLDRSTSKRDTALSQKKWADHEGQGSCPSTVQDYLDSCFPQHGPGPTGARPSGSVSAGTEYLSIWTISQVLMLRGKLGTGQKEEVAERPPTIPESSPELYSSAGGESEIGGPGTDKRPQELFSALSGRQEEGGLGLEATPDGILCSQSSPTKTTGEITDATGHAQPTASVSFSVQGSSVSPASKKSRASPSVARIQEQPGPTHRSLQMNSCDSTTLLAWCVTRGMPCSILVVVLYPCHLKEVKVKSGAWAGSTVPLATIVVTDQSGVEMKVVLWRYAAFWALTVYPGDLLLIKGVTIHEDKWRGEVVLQSTRSSKLLNLGQVTCDHQPPAPCGVSQYTLDELCSHMREKYRPLMTLPARIPQDPQDIPYVHLRSLKPDTLVHAVLRVVSSSLFKAWRTEAASFSRTGAVQKATLTVEQGDGQQRELVLWGVAMTWLNRIQRNKDAVWDFRVLLVKQNNISGHLDLHSTPWGACKPLFPGDTKATVFCSAIRPYLGLASFEIDLQTLLSQKYTGDVELRCHITGFQFQSSSFQDASPVLNGDTPLEGILLALSGDVTFTGCGQCGSELATDANGIYRSCYPCLPHTAVRRYYRPAHITVREGDREVGIRVPSVLVQKILKDVPPEKLNKAVASVSDRTFVQVVAETLCSLLSDPLCTASLTIHSHFQCDENSIPIAHDLLLLDFTLQR